jgi:predicted nucleotidyltransferase
MKQKPLEAHEPIEQPVSKAEALAAAQCYIAMLKERFGARRVIVFGSAAGQASWYEDSDLDLAVEGIRPEEFFKASSAVGALMPSGLQVDLVDLGNVYPEMRARILGAVEMPDEPGARRRAASRD